MAFQVKLPSHCVFRTHTAIFQNIRSALQNDIAKSIAKFITNLYQARNLYSVICSEMSTVCCKVKGEGISLRFL